MKYHWIETQMGVGIYWSNQLANEFHKRVWRRFEKCTVFAKQVYDIWTADLVVVFQIEQWLQISPDCD